MRRHRRISLVVCLALFASVTLVSQAGIAAGPSGATSHVVGSRITTPLPPVDTNRPNPIATGGTPYIPWLHQMIEETKEYFLTSCS